MSFLGYWLNEQQVVSVSLRDLTINLLKDMWLGVLLLILGVISFSTAVILAYPVLVRISF
jgi:hypothetical protein